MTMNDETIREEDVKEEDLKEEAEEIKEETAEETVTEEAEEEAAELEEAPSEEASNEEEEAFKDKYMRLMADFQNYKRRTEKEKSDVHAFANEKLVTDLLEVLDNFERALDQDAAEGFKEGMSLIFDQLNTVLKRAGMEEIEAFDKVFDPNFHNAVMMEDTDKVESGNVSEVIQKGYTLHGKVIRPSMVKVAN